MGEKDDKGGRASKCGTRTLACVSITLQVIMLIVLLAGVIAVVIRFLHDESSGVYCQSNPCKNGGACSESGSTYVCACTEHYIGRDCESFNPCNASPCQNGGNCSISGRDSVCACPAGYSGYFCEKANDPCSPNPCQNAGMCSQAGPGYQCTCQIGYIGVTCETVNPCLPNPCKHSGNCSTSGNGYYCACPSTHFGRICERELSEEAEAVETRHVMFAVLGMCIAVVIAVAAAIGVGAWVLRKLFKSIRLKSYT